MNGEPLTDEEYAQLLQLGGDNEMQTSKMQQQLEMAKQLRMMANPQMRQARGQIFAPGKAEAITGALGQMLGMGLQAKGMKGGEAIAANNQKQRALMLRGILGQRPQMGLQQQNPLMPQQQGVPDWQKQYPEF